MVAPRSVAFRFASWLIGAALFAACSTTGPSVPLAVCGTREWSGPWGNGQLELRPDATFVLTTERGGESRSLTGHWRGDAEAATLEVTASTPAGDRLVGSSIMVVLRPGSATLLGIDSLFDLHMGS